MYLQEINSKMVEQVVSPIPKRIGPKYNLIWIGNKNWFQ
jgi:hypothetical protein